VIKKLSRCAPKTSQALASATAYTAKSTWTSPYTVLGLLGSPMARKALGYDTRAATLAKTVALIG
jgi:hypothetical protein